MNDKGHWRDPQREDFESRNRKSVPATHFSPEQDARSKSSSAKLREKELAYEKIITTRTVLRFSILPAIAACIASLSTGYMVGDWRLANFQQKADSEIAKVTRNAKADADARVASAEKARDDALAAAQKTSKERMAQLEKDQQEAVAASKKAADDRVAKAFNDGVASKQKSIDSLNAQIQSLRELADARLATMDKQQAIIDKLNKKLNGN